MQTYMYNTGIHSYTLSHPESNCYGVPYYMICDKTVVRFVCAVSLTQFNVLP